MKIKYPSAVKRGETIGITAVSSKAMPERLDLAEENLRKMGYRVRETSNVRTGEKLVSSSGERRTKEFLELWEDENINYIMAARGGEFLMEMLTSLNKERTRLKKVNPKWVQGYSDTSLLLYYLTTNYNIATIHAENLSGYALKEMHKSIIDSLNMAKVEKGETYSQSSFDKYSKKYDTGEYHLVYELTEKVKYKTINGKRRFKLEGRMLGGCVGVINKIIGTKYDNTKKYIKQFKEGILWYLENCELSVLDLYRALWQMKEAGWFKNTRGFLFGRTMSNKAVEDFTYLDAISKALTDFNVPIVYDIDLGHVPPQLTFINGSYGIFEYDRGRGQLKQSYN
ncbi:MAG: LD-carboxypeptidase [Clostridia bacterium]|nr:LD-carboxypeptidase [Clostridia bacterium]MDD4376237.1 LD-carboxypeptidase [Clostridia bacterium]